MHTHQYGQYVGAISEGTTLTLRFLCSDCGEEFVDLLDFSSLVAK